MCVLLATNKSPCHLGGGVSPGRRGILLLHRMLGLLWTACDGSEGSCPNQVTPREAEGTQLRRLLYTRVLPRAQPSGQRPREQHRVQTHTHNTHLHQCFHDLPYLTCYEGCFIYIPVQHERLKVVCFAGIVTSLLKVAAPATTVAKGATNAAAACRTAANASRCG